MLDINMESYQGVLFVRLKGKLNKFSLDKLQLEVSKLIKLVGIKNIVFNISELSEIDYEGIEELTENCNYCTANKGRALFVSDKESHYTNFKDYVVSNEKKAKELITK